MLASHEWQLHGLSAERLDWINSPLWAFLSSSLKWEQQCISHRWVSGSHWGNAWEALGIVSWLLWNVSYLGNQWLWDCGIFFMSFQLGFIRHMRKNSQVAWSLMRHQDKCKLSWDERQPLCPDARVKVRGLAFLSCPGAHLHTSCREAGLWLQEDLDSRDLRNGWSSVSVFGNIKDQIRGWYIDQAKL